MTIGLPCTRPEVSKYASDLRAYFLDERIPDEIYANPVISPVDDCGSICLTEAEYTLMIQCLDNESESFRDKVLTYLESRMIAYHSPRRGKCYSLRGNSYYQLFLIGKQNKNLLKSLAFRDLSLDLEIARLIQGHSVHHYIVYVVLEHIKHRLFQIQYCVTKTILTNGAPELQFILSMVNNQIQLIWHCFMDLIVTEKTERLTLDFDLKMDWIFPVEPLIVADAFAKVRELDSAKTLLWYSNRIFQSETKYDTMVSLLYGGAELPYAINAYHSVMGYPLDAQVVPMIYSLNRVLKGEVRLTTELWTQNDFSQLGLICPEQFMAILQGSRQVIVCDNNVTTGYSAESVVRYLRNNGLQVDLAVPEVHLQEIQQIITGKVESKNVYITAASIRHKPIGEYVTCFGLNDRSRVVDRVKFLLGKGDYMQLSGYDFDDTLAKTGSLHRKAWNAALQEVMGCELDVKDFPNNSGKTFEEAAHSLYNELRERTELDEEQFVKELCERKLRHMLSANYKTVPMIARTANIVRDIANRDQQIIVTNNKLAFVQDFLEKTGYIQYFSHIICQDKALDVRSGEVIVILGRAKPHDTGYLEASSYFGLPSIVKYYGDNPKYDGQFAQNLGAEFILIN